MLELNFEGRVGLVEVVESVLQFLEFVLLFLKPLVSVFADLVNAND